MAELTYKDLVEQCDGILTIRDNFSMLYPSYDQIQLVEVIKAGAYQYDEFKRVFNYLKTQNRLAGDTFVDIGSNVGTHMIYALNEPEIRAGVAVEPSASNMRFLRMNLALNGLADRVQTVHSAICDYNGETELSTNPINCGDNRLVRRVDRDLETGFGTERVSAMTLDRLFDSYDSARTAFLWMDTQGSEGLILGASERIKETTFPIYLEFWPQGLARLKGYKALRRFVTEHVKKIIHFVDDQSYGEYAPGELDQIYLHLKYQAKFCDLLLLR